MNKYSKKSLTELNTCHEDIQTIFSVVLQAMDHTIIVGHRGKEDQTTAFVKGNSKVQWPDSKHNSLPSMAVDVSPFPIPLNWGKDSRDELEKFRYFAFYVIGVADTLYLSGLVKHRLRWGGDWDRDSDVTDNTFNDLVHFELVEG